MIIKRKKLTGKERNRLIGRLIANTQKRKRPDSIITIANIINDLASDMGGMGAVSDAVKVSSEMLRRFLSVNELSEPVRALVAKRELDSVAFVNNLKNFDNKGQLFLAREYVSGRLTSDDIKILTPYYRSTGENVRKLTRDVLLTKDKKSYLIRLRVPGKLTEFKNLEGFQNKLETVIGKGEIINFDLNGETLSVEITPKGLKRIRQKAKRDGNTLAEYLRLLAEISMR